MELFLTQGPFSQKVPLTHRIGQAAGIRGHRLPIAADLLQLSRRGCRQFPGTW